MRYVIEKSPKTPLAFNTNKAGPAVANALWFLTRIVMWSAFSLFLCINALLCSCFAAFAVTPERCLELKRRFINMWSCKLTDSLCMINLFCLTLNSLKSVCAWMTFGLSLSFCSARELRVYQTLHLSEPNIVALQGHWKSSSNFEHKTSFSKFLLHHQHRPEYYLCL